MDGTEDSAESSWNVADLTASWTYIKEGNASFVIGHKKDNIVYRLWKCDPGANTTMDCSEEECWLKVNYIKHVIQPMCGKFANVPQCVAVSKEFVDAAGKAFRDHRPAKRRKKVIDPQQRIVLCQPNFCFLGDSPMRGRTIALELKPKLGFICSSSLGSVMNGRQERVCYFCMHQALKQEEGAWDYTSKYCPVKLFTGNHKNMRHALQCLFSTPQNNLCVFKDGELVYPGSEKSLPTEQEQQHVREAIQDWFGGTGTMPSWPESLCQPTQLAECAAIQRLISLVIQALCRSDQTHTKGESEHGSLPWIPCHAGHCDEANAGSECDLPAGCILDRILRMQRLDTYGIDMIYRVYQRYEAYIEEHPKERERLRLNDCCLAVNDRLLSLKTRPTICSPAEVDHLSMEDCVAILRAYMVSRTARDCSIMVALQPVGLQEDQHNHHSGEKDIISLGEERFRFACHLIDLDPKSPVKIPQYHQLEHQIHRTYTNR